MKTERITVLASPEFKAFLACEAETAGLSISELVRQRCEQKAGKDEELLRLLTDQLRLSNLAANAALDRALMTLEKTQAGLNALRANSRASEAI